MSTPNDAALEEINPKSNTEFQYSLLEEHKNNPSSMLAFKYWRILLVLLLLFKIFSFLFTIGTLSGGVVSLCDCSNRTFITPFQNHHHGFGIWYQNLVWTHLVFGGFMLLPMFVALFTRKGSSFHVIAGRVFIFCWFVQMIVGLSSGGIAHLARGMAAGQDIDGPHAGHYYESFPLYMYLLFTFLLSAACDHLSSGSGALQVRRGPMPPIFHNMLIFGSFLTLFHGAVLLILATFTLGNHPDSDTSSAVYPGLYYFFITVEMVMTVLNLKFWLAEEEARNNDWLINHVRSMLWTVCLTLFFAVENGAYKAIKAQQVSEWLLLPGWFLNVLLWGGVIFFFSRKISSGSVSFI